VADVRVTGSYGSEVLRGTRAIKADLLTGEVIHGDLYSWMDLAVSTFENNLNCNDLTFSVFRQAPWYGYGRISVEQSQVLLRTPFLDNDFLALMYRAPQDARKSSALTANLIRYQDPRLAALPTDRALTGGTHGFSTMLKYLFSRLLFKADYYCKSGMPQWLEQIHYALRFLELERLVVGRHRLTFFRGWFRKELSDYVKDLLLDPASLSRPHLNPKATEAMILRHMKGDRNFTMPLQRLINVELIYRCFLERPAFDHQRRISMPEYEVAAR
jgi:asparagine synthase (glutamine-hydrolysing)